MDELAELAADIVSLKIKNTKLLDAVLNAEAQRDELLAACEAALADGFREVDMQSWAAPMVAQLRAAIANAKGE